MNLTDKCRHGEELRYVCKLCEGDIGAFEAALAKSAEDRADAEAEWARVDEEAKALRARVAELHAALDLADCTQRDGGDVRHCGEVRCWRCRAEAAEQRVAELERECAQMSEEFGLPPTIRPAEGEIRRFMAERKDSRARASAAEQRVAELEQTRERLREDWYAEQRRREAAEQRAKRMDGVLRSILSVAEHAPQVGIDGEVCAIARAALAESGDEPYCACGRRVNECDGSRAGCAKRAPSPAESERRAVVEYMRTAARREEWGDLSRWTKHSAVGECVWELATAIERGEHIAASESEAPARCRCGHDSSQHYADSEARGSPCRECVCLGMESDEAPARDVKCPRCYGHGETAWDDTRMVRCSACNGTGKAREGGR